MAEPVRVGILGYGFMGRTHAAAYEWARKNGGLDVRVRAVADPNGSGCLAAAPGNLAGTSDSGLPPDTTLLADAETLLGSDEIDLVSICTPTDTHVDLAVAALEAGKHVLVEKPVAVNTEDAVRLADAAERAAERGLVCMPAMCMRFWPEWSWLKSMIASGEYGGVLSASFTRLGSKPAWSGFYADDARSGGAILDLHIHDVDFLLHCFGVPESVTSRGDPSHVTTLYEYPTGPAHVTAEGGWMNTPSYPFTMRYRVVFDDAVADFDLARTEPLVLHDQSGARPIAVPAGSAYDHQAVAVVRAVTDGTLSPVSMGDAIASMRIVGAERASAEQMTRQRVPG